MPMMGFIRALILHIGKDGTSTWSFKNKNNRVGILRSVEYVHTASQPHGGKKATAQPLAPSLLPPPCMRDVTCGKMDISLYMQIHDGVAFPCRAWNGAHWMALPTASARAYVRAFITRYLNKSVVVYSKSFSFLWVLVFFCLFVVFGGVCVCMTLVFFFGKFLG